MLVSLNLMSVDLDFTLKAFGCFQLDEGKRCAFYVHLEFRRECFQWKKNPIFFLSCVIFVCYYMVHKIRESLANSLIRPRSHWEGVT